MYNFRNYYEAKTIDEAIFKLSENPDLKIVAGGTDILIKMHGGKLEKIDLLSIHNIASLKNIKKLEDGTINIGPLATFSQIANDPLIAKSIPVLAEASLSMGGPQIRNVATIGGNICNGATSADSASTLFALNAKLKLKSLKDERIIPIEEFYLGPGKVDLRPSEMLVAILIDQKDYKGYSGKYIKFSMRNAMDIATLGVSVLCKVKDNLMEDLRIGLGVAAPTPIRCHEAEEYARNKEVTTETIKEIGKLAVKPTKARTSWRASKEYREHLVEELTGRALKSAILRAGGVEIA
ncbi:MAG: xanthine dehydrogenase FAD-binding subunit XdhB [Zhaonellaceae bacterium]|jgi:xanthine dehydrogenase FAD-binding subunit|nr:xanthine dehydrogenase FAD-binding subunit XdhB [Clostridia bacterium]